MGVLQISIAVLAFYSFVKRSLRLIKTLMTLFDFRMKYRLQAHAKTSQRFFNTIN